MNSGQRTEPSEYPDVVLRQKAEDESYKRYKHLCYRNLAIEAALSFVLGLLFAFLLKL